jgi:hypothetical protein
MWLSQLSRLFFGKRTSGHAARRERLPRLEHLEDRTVLSTLTPTTFLDSGGGFRLRDAIIAANNNASRGTVTINLKSGTYVLTAANSAVTGQENAAATGDLDITSTRHKLIIRGQGSTGAGATIIDASALNDRVFQMLAGTEVVIQGVVIKGGLAQDNGVAGTVTAPNLPGKTDAEGGAISNFRGSLTLRNVLVDSNKAAGGDGAAGTSASPSGGAGLNALGGGLFMREGFAKLDHATFLSNTTVGGKGGDAFDPVIGGTGGNGGLGSGGGLFIKDSCLQIGDDCIISANTAQGGNGGNGEGDDSAGVGGSGSGGGLYSLRGFTTTCDNVTIDHNKALGGAGGRGGSSTGFGSSGGNGNGGGLYLFDASFNLAEGGFIGYNDALGGGGGGGFGADGGSGGSGNGGGIYMDGACGS